MRYDLDEMAGEWVCHVCHSGFNSVGELSSHYRKHESLEARIAWHSLPTKRVRKMIYLGGSMRNPQIPEIANRIEERLGLEVYDSWHCSGPDADDFWQKHAKVRGLSYIDALEDWHAQTVFQTDKMHLDQAIALIMVMPCGKSAFAEMGYMVGQGKPVYVLLPEEPERFDVMLNFASKVYTNLETMLEELHDDITNHGQFSRVTPMGQALKVVP